MKQAKPGLNKKIIWTIGHSRRPLEEFVAMLRAFDIQRVVDIRRFPVPNDILSTIENRCPEFWQKKIFIISIFKHWRELRARSLFCEYSLA
ncbi:MAG TPA: hypothetical protein VIL90_02220 [Puia sp.]|jgi:hypothetical protein